MGLQSCHLHKFHLVLPSPASQTGNPIALCGESGKSRGNERKLCLLPPKRIAAFAVSLEGLASRDPALLRTIAGWAEDDGFLPSLL